MRILVALFSLAVLFSAISLVTVRHENRQQFIELSSLKAQRDTLMAEWSRLQLQHATMSRGDLIEQQARTQLGLSEPDHVEVLR